jgi:hypothetical protein
MFRNHRKFLAFLDIKKKILFAMGLGIAKIFLSKFYVKNPCAETAFFMQC